jgi:hypothetical protein
LKFGPNPALLIPIKQVNGACVLRYFEIYYLIGVKGVAVIILYTKQAQKGKSALTQNERDILSALEQDMRETGGKPLGRGWASLGPLKQYAPNAYHCHLTRNKVAVWLIEKGEMDGDINTVLCCFEYLGQRGHAPY